MSAPSIWSVLTAFAVFWGIVFAFSRKDYIRAECETLLGKFSLEAKGKPKPRKRLKKNRK